MAWHYTPRRSLERWVVPNGEYAGKIFRYERGKDAPIAIPPAVAAAENYIYAPDHGPHTRDSTLEKWLSTHVDGPGAAAIQKLIDGNRLTEGDKDVLALYFGFQASRVPRVRDFLGKFLTGQAKRQLRSLAELDREQVVAIVRESNEEFSDDDVDDLIERARADGPFYIVASNILWLQHLQREGRRIAQRVRQLPWQLVEAPGDLEFVTSDNPVATGTLPSYTGTTHPGWGVPNVEHTLPLDPKHVLLVAYHARGKMSKLEPWCRDIVRRTTLQAQRYVFTRTPMRRIGWFLREPMQ